VDNTLNYGMITPTTYLEFIIQQSIIILNAIRGTGSVFK